MRLPFLLLLFTLATTAVTININQNFPDSLVAGSVYTASFTFNSTIHSTYKIYINIANAGANETKINNCTEEQPGKHVCAYPAIPGTNTAILNLSLVPNLKPGKYPIQIIFEISEETYTAPQVTAEGVTSGGGNYYIPRPPQKITPATSENNTSENTTKKPIKTNITIIDNLDFKDQILPKEKLEPNISMPPAEFITAITKEDTLPILPLLLIPIAIVIAILVLLKIKSKPTVVEEVQ